MTRVILLLAFSVVISSCSMESGSGKADPSVLLKADQAFSVMSIEQGMKAAFSFYAHPDAVMLRESSHPIVGADAVSDRLAGTDDSSIRFYWEPVYADISASADLGYTYGYWHMEQGDSLAGEGTYVSIWKQNSEGEWKWVLDTGNNGIGPKSE